MSKKHIGLLAALMLLLNLIVPSSILGFSQSAIPEGYDATAPEGVVLKEGEYYKQLTSLEGSGVKTEHINATRVYSGLNAVTGEKTLEVTFNDGSPNAIQITEFRFGVSATGVTELKPVDFTQASYLQFYINNTMGTELQLDVIDLGNNGNYASIKSDVEVDFYNTTTNEWSKIVTKTAYNDAYICIPIAPQTAGFVRVPISESAFNNMSAISLSIVDAFRIWFHAPGCAGGSKIYMDEIGLVHVPDAPVEDRYEPYAAAQLQDGQAFKLITSFEGETGVGNGTQYTDNNDRWSYVNTNQASGDTAVELAYNNGNVNGHINLSIPLSGTAIDWSKADYLQFYVDNTDDKILDIFYFKIIADGNIQMELKNGAKGILFYDLNAKVWMELPVGATAKYNGVHGIKFPSSGKGVVRIPLTGEVFSNFNASHLATMSRISLFTHIGGHSAGAKAFFDDFGLVNGPATTNKDDAPWGYTKSSANNSNLLQGQFFKLLTGFEGKGLRATDIDTTNPNFKLQYSDEHAGSGNKSAKLTFHNGSNNAIKITGFDFEYKPVSNDWSQAKYLQFYVNNPNNSVLHLGNIQYYYNGAARALKNGVEVNFCDAETRMWSTLVTKNMGNATYVGVEIPANTRGIVRIPLDADTYDSFNQAEMGAVERLLMFIQMPGCSDPSNVYIDDLGLIAGEDNVFPILTDYEETDDVQLNPGEKFKLLTGFEDESVPFTTDAPAGTVVRSTDVANSGDHSLAVRYTDGSASGHRNFSLDTSSVNYSDWSQAKYLQFYVKNNSTQPDLQLFYIQVNSGNKMVNYDAKGIKLFNIATGRWSDLEVVPNSDHFLAGTGTGDVPKVYVPTICIPAGFEGYVRIPLTDENFTNTTLSEELPNITRFAMFSLIKGFAAPVTVYYDDFGLVTYEGDQAPEYVDYPVNPGDGEDEDEDKEDLDDGKDDEYLDIETTFSLSGTLLGLDGNPLANAKVTLNGEITVTTDSKGQYLFESVKTDLHELSVIGADDTDYGYITFEVLTGFETRYSGTDIRIGHQENGLIVNFKMGELGPEIISVTDGTVTPEETDSDNDDSDKDNDGNPQTGVEFTFIPVVMLVISFAVAALLIKRNRFFAR
jgi:hypothetical protein